MVAFKIRRRVSILISADHSIIWTDSFGQTVEDTHICIVSGRHIQLTSTFDTVQDVEDALAEHGIPGLVWLHLSGVPSVSDFPTIFFFSAEYRIRTRGLSDVWGKWLRL